MLFYWITEVYILVVTIEYLHTLSLSLFLLLALSTPILINIINHLTFLSQREIHSRKKENVRKIDDDKKYYDECSLWCECERV